MFKSIQSKLVLLFILVILSVMITVGTFIIGNVTRFYYSDFMAQIKPTISDTKFIEKLDDAVEAKVPLDKINELMMAYYGRIGIDSYRNYAILDGLNGSFLIGSDELKIHSVEITQNILTAISGKIGDLTIQSNKYIDFAYPVMVNNKVLYIIYIYETKDELNNFSKSMFAIILQALLLGLLIAIVLGYLLSKTITTPIKNITIKAEKIADGEFEIGEESPFKDEIGTLSNTFRTMGQRLKETVFEIANQKTRLEKIMEYSNDGIVAFDTSGELLLINPTGRKYLGIENEKVNFDSFFAEIFDDISLGDFLYLKKDKQIVKEAEYNGFYLNFYFGSFLYANDKIGGIIVDVQDITQGRKLEMSRREFVANVSHELRTPLTTIKAYIETLMDGSVDKDTEIKFLDTINRETDRMTRLVSDLLTLSRLDNGVVKLNLTKMKIETILSDVAEKLQFEATKKKQHLTYNIINEIPIIPIDRDRMEQVIINIISNAIKYTQNNGVIKMYSSFVSNNAIIRVRDNGMGIPKKDLERIFERFYRVDKARAREQGGTGLGLAIAREIINAHAGEVSINSEVNEGTEIIITIPVEKFDIDEED
jgi:two-component system sensor histidine kinase VicK